MHTAQPAIILNGLFRLIHAASRRHLQLSGYRHIRLQSIPDACLMTVEVGFDILPTSIQQFNSDMSGLAAPIRIGRRSLHGCFRHTGKAARNWLMTINVCKDVSA